MPYTPTLGVFVDGEIIDAVDFTDEFSKVSNGMAQDVANLEQDIVNVANDGIQDTDTKLANLNIDGGTF